MAKRKRKPQQSRVLLVSLSELKQLNDKGLYPRFSFAMQGLYALHSKIARCKAVLNRGN